MPSFRSRESRWMATLRRHVLTLLGRMCEACASSSCGRAYCGPMGDGSRCACPCGTPEHGAAVTSHG
jgi:hypothetical protein